MALQYMDIWCSSSILGSWNSPWVVGYFLYSDWWDGTSKFNPQSSVSWEKNIKLGYLPVLRHSSQLIIYPYLCFGWYFGLFWFKPFYPRSLPPSLMILLVNPAIFTYQAGGSPEVVESEESERLDETLRLRSEIVRIKAQGAALGF